MYKLILSLNTRLKHTSKSCPQNGDGLVHIFLLLDSISISMYIMCVILCLFGALSRHKTPTHSKRKRKDTKLMMWGFMSSDVARTGKKRLKGHSPKHNYAIHSVTSLRKKDVVNQCLDFGYRRVTPVHAILPRS